MSKRQALIEAAKTILWNEGFEAMSPKKVMRASGAGQGSLYHHFDGKEHLAAVALEELDIDMRAVADELFSTEKEPLQRLSDYLLKPRDALKGCRFGRLTSEQSVFDGRLSEIVSGYLRYVGALIETALEEAQKNGQLPQALPAVAFTKTILAIVQGGYVLARGTGDASQMQQALEGAWAMIEYQKIQ